LTRGSGPGGCLAASGHSSPSRSPSPGARRPELLVLDEPAANLDPLARRDFLDSVTRAVADSGEGMTTVFSSHLVADLERTCGYLILLAGGQVRLAGQVDALLERNHARSLDDLVVTYLREVPR
jgi:ABC-2 type transport system ATP-binding protein